MCQRAQSAEDVRSTHLRRHDILTPGKTATLSWSKCGHQTGSIRIVAEPVGIRLVYRTTAKRMRWRTYQRLEKRYKELQRQGMARRAYAKFARLR
jgi:hypothetical protein